VIQLRALLALIATYFLFRGAIHGRLRSLFDPYSFSGDALQHIPPLWYAHERSLFSLDYIREYYWKALFPPLFKAVYWLVTFFAEPSAASKTVSCTLVILFVATVSRASWRLAGGASAFTTLLLATGGTLKNFPFMSGLQRGFGAWLCAVMLCFVVSGNITWLGITVVITAMFYPAAAVFGLITLAGIVCLPRRFLESPERWSLRTRATTLILFTSLTAIAVLPQTIAGSHYGQRLSIDNESEFAEWGPDGRYSQGDRGVPMPFWTKLSDNTLSSLLAGKLVREKKLDEESETLDQHHSPNEDLRRDFHVALALSLLCAVVLSRRTAGWISPAAARIIVYLAAIGCSFAAATALFPLLYIPTRYVVTPLPALVAILFPALWTGALRDTLKVVPSTIRAGSVFGFLMVILYQLGWFSLTVKPLPTASGNRELFSYIRSLPRESVIAGWSRGTLTTVPLFTGRNVLLQEEAHQIFHRDFLIECRKRMEALIKLYATTDRGPLDDLQRQFGVTHLLIDKKHLKIVPSYFAPFKAEMAAARAAIGSEHLYLEQLIKDATVFQLHNTVLVDLSRVPRTPQETASRPDAR
jgi:hypothetical protein